MISAFKPASTRGNLLRRRSKAPHPQRDLDNDTASEHASITPSKHTPRPLRAIKESVAASGPLRPFRLLRQDRKNIWRRYVSDWTLFNQQVFSSAVYVFFTNLLPGITFASDLVVLTDRNWGTIEVVLSTGICGLIFSIASIQPLTILGVTGPFSVLAENIYELSSSSFGVPFLPLMAWSLIHAGWMLLLLAVINAHDWTMCYVTTFSTEIFSLLNSIIYFQKAMQELQRAHDSLSFAAFLYAIIGAVGTMLVAIFLSTAESWKPLFHRFLRTALAEYAAAISIILWIGIPHIGELSQLDKSTLSVSTSFTPTSPERSSFFVAFWDLPVKWMFASIIPGLIITVLFFLDHEISSVICTVDRYGIKKPGGFAWDVALLGLTTALCGVLGIPPANGLLPQAPLHSESLIHKEQETGDGTATTEKKEVQRVYEQRWSSFLHSTAILCFVAPPLQQVLGLTPTSVLAGLFMFMGEQSLAVKFFYLLTPASELPPLPNAVQAYSGIHAYTVVQIIITVLIFVITLTKGAPVFPLIIVALVPLRLLAMNRIWNRETLRFVDAWACKEGTPEDDEDAKIEEKKPASEAPTPSTVTLGGV